MPTPPLPALGDARLYRWERAGLALLAVALVAFGGIVLMRSALQTARKTDFGVYCRAAHAVRADKPIYDKQTCDNNGWHYCYPPPFAVAMLPFADPFDWQDHAGYLPYAVSVVAWYLLSVGLIGWSVHRFAAAVLPGEVPGSRRWWYARTVPAYVCAGGLAYTLARGQVNILLVALIAGMFAATCRGHRFRAGLWLAAAVTLKVIPAYLLIDPLVRRDWRNLLGVAAGCVVLLVAVPAAVWGWGGMVENNRTFVNVVLAPGALGGGGQLAKELTDTAATDSQSFQAAFHNLTHPNAATRPANADKAAKLFHLALSGLLTLGLLAAAVVWGIRPHPAERLIFLGCATLAMLHITPVSHTHYYALGLPIAAGLWLQGLRDHPGRVRCDRPTAVMLAGWGVLTAVMLLPYELPTLLRMNGAGPAASVALWAFGLRRCVRYT
jgi:hypothetical protein